MTTYWLTGQDQPPAKKKSIYKKKSNLKLRSCTSSIQDLDFFRSNLRDHTKLRILAYLDAPWHILKDQDLFWLILTNSDATFPDLCTWCIQLHPNAALGKAKLSSKSNNYLLFALILSNFYFCLTFCFILFLENHCFLLCFFKSNFWEIVVLLWL